MFRFRRFRRRMTPVAIEPPLPDDPNERALMLLMSYLTPHQRKTYTEHGWFYVMTKKGVFVIRNGVSVARLNNRGELERFYGFNVDPFEHIPRADHLLAQKLLLEGNVRHAMRISCRHGSSPPASAHDKSTFKAFLKEDDKLRKERRG